MAVVVVVQICCITSRNLARASVMDDGGWRCIGDGKVSSVVIAETRVSKRCMGCYYLNVWSIGDEMIGGRFSLTSNVVDFEGSN